MKRRRIQAFKQAPWRVRLRLTGGSMLPLIAILIVFGMYLAVNARHTRVGREVLVLEEQRENLQRKNAELTANLAVLTSPERMVERAQALGFRPAEPDEVLYVAVEGYFSPTPYTPPKPPAIPDSGVGALSPAYTETLGAWLSRWLGIGISNRD
jgi:cell division protein FtsL